MSKTLEEEEKIALLVERLNQISFGKVVIEKAHNRITSIKFEGEVRFRLATEEKDNGGKGN